MYAALSKILVDAQKEKKIERTDWNTAICNCDPFHLEIESPDNGTQIM